MVNGQYPADRLPSDLMNASPEFLDEDLIYTNLGWDDGSIEIIQENPLPTEIAAIYGKLTGSNT